jgi:riboflavin kinase/FMN adenylyltransferase
MHRYESLDEVSFSDSWLTIGVFDGVHRGHQQLVSRLVSGAHDEGTAAIVLTFAPHPALILGGREIRCLTTAAERADLLARLGVDALITEPFTRELSRVSAEDFVRRLKERLGLRHLLIGYDFALGNGREGNSSRLKEIGRELGFVVEVVEAMGDDSGVFSSTEIRKLVFLGQVAEAAHLLGHAYALSGTVVHGDGRGHRINVPTANLAYPPEKVIPANGIYACWARLPAGVYRAAVNIGINPTFTPDKPTPSVEAHLLDFAGEIYGQTMRLDFVARLRDEIRFGSVDALVQQIQTDVGQVRKLLPSAPREQAL